MYKKALITGATGFIGSKLCRRLLKESWEVYIISKENDNYDNIKDIYNKVNIYEYSGNINEMISHMKKIRVDVVFHLASAIVTEHKIEDVNNLLDSNLKFGTHILEGMKYSETKYLVNTGSYWQNFESDDYNPVDLYAATKEAFQSIVKYYAEVEGIKAITLKLFDTYSENDKRNKLLNLLKKYAEEGSEVNLSLGEQYLDLVHVDDVVSAFINAFSLLNSGEVKYEIYGVSSERLIKLKEVVAYFEKVLNEKIKVNFGGRPYRKREVMLPCRTLKKMPNWNINIKLEEGIRKIIEKKENIYEKE